MTNRRPLLLIVDDDAGSARLLGRLLEQDGYEIAVETTGAGAIERLARGRIPDAVITDYNLPGVDGLVVGRHARATRADIPIIVLTGDPYAVEHSPRALEAVDVLAKPLDYALLVQHLRASVPVHS